MTKKISLSENAETVARSRYFLEDEDWEDCARRVARTIATPEGGKATYYTDIFTEMIYNMDFLPAGRILRNSGRPRGSLFNCYHLPCGDSIEEIGQFMKDALTLWSEGGGVGCNFSGLRPRGDNILGKGGTSSGLVSFIKASDALAATIESGGQRRAAALALVEVSHPEVMDYIDSKLEREELHHYNISVAVNEYFLKAVEADREWEFRFKQQSYGKIRARTIWDKILTNMIKCAEPGLINWTNLQKNNSYYYDPVRGTNPCGEAVLAPYDVCDLGSLVLPNFITGTVNTNWKKLAQTIKTAVRFLDNVIDVNKYTIKEIDIKGHNSRRIGLGVMGLAEYLFAKEIRYGSERAVVEVERLMKFVRDNVYLSLIELAKEKGAFPKFDPVNYGNASFIRSLQKDLRTDIKKHGSRCVTGMALAPTGTISLLADVTSGIEPLPAKAYKRKDRISERIYIHPKYKDFLMNGGEIPEWFIDSHDLRPQDHFEIQAMVQRYTDGAVSKTINLPAGTTEEQLDELLLEYIRDLKGVTVYVDGSRDGQPLNRMTLDEVKKHINMEHESNLDEKDVKCRSGACEI